MKEKKILIKFIIYFLFGFAIIFYGITHKVVPTVLADTVNVGYVTDKTVILYENNNAQAMISLPVNTTINQYLYNILAIQLSNQTISKDYTYMLELYLPEAKLKNINNIYVVGGNNNSTTCQTIGLDNSNNSYPKIYFKCPANLSNLTIGLNNDSPTTSTESITTSNNFRWSYAYLRYYTEDDDIDLGPVISNATNNTNNIINNNNSNTDKIINNQNELFGTRCENLWNTSLQVGPFAYSDGLHYDFNTYYSNATPITVSPGDYYISYIIDTSKGDNGALFYNNGQYLGYQMLSSDGVIHVPVGANQMNFNFASANGTYRPTNIMLTRGTLLKSYCEYGSYSSKLDEQTNAINGVTGALTDDTPVDMSSLGNTAGWLPAGPIDSIINLPLNFLNGLLNALNKTCSPLSVPMPFLNQNITIPCISTIFNKITGLPTLWGWVGAISSVMILYKYLIALYKYYDDLTTLKANFISDFGGAP